MCSCGRDSATLEMGVNREEKRGEERGRKMVRGGDGRKIYEMLKLGVCCVFDCLTEVIVLKILHSHLGESGFTSLYSWEIEK